MKKNRKWISLSSLIVIGSSIVVPFSFNENKNNIVENNNFSNNNDVNNLTNDALINSSDIQKTSIEKVQQPNTIKANNFDVSKSNDPKIKALSRYTADTFLSKEILQGQDGIPEPEKTNLIISEIFKIFSLINESPKDFITQEGDGYNSLFEGNFDGGSATGGYGEFSVFRRLYKRYIAFSNSKIIVDNQKGEIKITNFISNVDYATSTNHNLTHEFTISGFAPIKKGFIDAYRNIAYDADTLIIPKEPDATESSLKNQAYISFYNHIKKYISVLKDHMVLGIWFEENGELKSLDKLLNEKVIQIGDYEIDFNAPGGAELMYMRMKLKGVGLFDKSTITFGSILSEQGLQNPNNYFDLTKGEFSKEFLNSIINYINYSGTDLIHVLFKNKSNYKETTFKNLDAMIDITDSNNMQIGYKAPLTFARHDSTSPYYFQNIEDDKRDLEIFKEKLINASVGGGDGKDRYLKNLNRIFIYPISMSEWNKKLEMKLEIQVPFYFDATGILRNETKKFTVVINNFQPMINYNKIYQGFDSCLPVNNIPNSKELFPESPEAIQLVKNKILENFNFSEKSKESFGLGYDFNPNSDINVSYHSQDNNKISLYEYSFNGNYYKENAAVGNEYVLYLNNKTDSKVFRVDGFGAERLKDTTFKSKIITNDPIITGTMALLSLESPEVLLAVQRAIQKDYYFSNPFPGAIVKNVQPYNVENWTLTPQIFGGNATPSYSYEVEAIVNGRPALIGRKVQIEGFTTMPITTQSTKFPTSIANKWNDKTVKEFIAEANTDKNLLNTLKEEIFMLLENYPKTLTIDDIEIVSIKNDPSDIKKSVIVNYNTKYEISRRTTTGGIPTIKKSIDRSLQITDFKNYNDTQIPSVIDISTNPIYSEKTAKDLINDWYSIKEIFFNHLLGDIPSGLTLDGVSWTYNPIANNRDGIVILNDIILKYAYLDNEVISSLQFKGPYKITGLLCRDQTILKDTINLVGSEEKTRIPSSYKNNIEQIKQWVLEEAIINPMNGTTKKDINFDEFIDFDDLNGKIILKNVKLTKGYNIDGNEISEFNPIKVSKLEILGFKKQVPTTWLNEIKWNGDRGLLASQWRDKLTAANQLSFIKNNVIKSQPIGSNVTLNYKGEWFVDDGKGIVVLQWTIDSYYDAITGNLVKEPLTNEVKIYGFHNQNPTIINPLVNISGLMAKDGILYSEKNAESITERELEDIVKNSNPNNIILVNLPEETNIEITKISAQNDISEIIVDIKLNKYFDNKGILVNADLIQKVIITGFKQNSLSTSIYAIINTDIQTDIIPQKIMEQNNILGEILRKNLINPDPTTEISFETVSKDFNNQTGIITLTNISLTNYLENGTLFNDTKKINVSIAGFKKVRPTVLTEKTFLVPSSTNISPDDFTVDQAKEIIFNELKKLNSTDSGLLYGLPEGFDINNIMTPIFNYDYKKGEIILKELYVNLYYDNDAKATLMTDDKLISTNVTFNGFLQTYQTVIYDSQLSYEDVNTAAYEVDNSKMLDFILKRTANLPIGYSKSNFRITGRKDESIFGRVTLTLESNFYYNADGKLINDNKWMPINYSGNYTDSRVITVIFNKVSRPSFLQPTSSNYNWKDIIPTDKIEEKDINEVLKELAFNSIDNRPPEMKLENITISNIRANNLKGEISFTVSILNYFNSNGNFETKIPLKVDNVLPTHTITSMRKITPSNFKSEIFLNASNILVQDISEYGTNPETTKVVQDYIKTEIFNLARVGDWPTGFSFNDIDIESNFLNYNNKNGEISININGLNSFYNNQGILSTSGFPLKNIILKGFKKTNETIFNNTTIDNISGLLPSETTLEDIISILIKNNSFSNIPEGAKIEIVDTPDNIERNDKTGQIIISDVILSQYYNNLGVLIKSKKSFGSLIIQNNSKTQSTIFKTEFDVSAIIEYNKIMPNFLGDDIIKKIYREKFMSGGIPLTFSPNFDITIEKNKVERNNLDGSVQGTLLIKNFYSELDSSIVVEPVEKNFKITGLVISKPTTIGKRTFQIDDKNILPSDLDIEQIKNVIYQKERPESENAILNTPINFSSNNLIIEITELNNIKGKQFLKLNLSTNNYYNSKGIIMSDILALGGVTINFSNDTIPGPTIQNIKEYNTGLINEYAYNYVEDIKLKNYLFTIKDELWKNLPTNFKVENIIIDKAEPNNREGFIIADISLSNFYNEQGVQQNAKGFPHQFKFTGFSKVPGGKTSLNPNASTIGIDSGLYKEIVTDINDFSILEIILEKKSQIFINLPADINIQQISVERTDYNNIQGWATYSVSLNNWFDENSNPSYESYNVGILKLTGFKKITATTIIGATTEINITDPLFVDKIPQLLSKVEIFKILFDNKASLLEGDIPKKGDTPEKLFSINKKIENGQQVDNYQFDNINGTLTVNYIVNYSYLINTGEEITPFTPDFDKKSLTGSVMLTGFSRARQTLIGGADQTYEKGIISAVHYKPVAFPFSVILKDMTPSELLSKLVDPSEIQVQNSVKDLIIINIVWNAKRLYNEEAALCIPKDWSSDDVIKGYDLGDPSYFKVARTKINFTNKNAQNDAAGILDLNIHFKSIYDGKDAIQKEMDRSIKIKDLKIFDNGANAKSTQIIVTTVSVVSAILILILILCIISYKIKKAKWR